MKVKIQKKSMLCLAALAINIPVSHGQSSVNISGFLDIGIYRDSAKTMKIGPLKRSNIAISATEDLGNGLRAHVMLSHRFETDTGENESFNKPFFHGESTLGLSGRFGAVKLGRRLDAIYDKQSLFDPWDNFHRIASPAWNVWNSNYPSDPQGNNNHPEWGRLNNGIYYDSPSVHGFSLHLSGSPETDATALNKPLATVLLYKNTRFSGMLGYGKNSQGNTDAVVGWKTTFHHLSLMGSYDVSKRNGSTAKATTLGLLYKMNPVTLRAGWGRLNRDGDKKKEIFSLGGSYNLSRRTSLYADAAHNIFPDKSVNTFSIGISHGF